MRPDEAFAAPVSDEKSEAPSRVHVRRDKARQHCQIVAALPSGITPPESCPSPAIEDQANVSPPSVFREPTLHS